MMIFSFLFSLKIKRILKSLTAYAFHAAALRRRLGSRTSCTRQVGRQVDNIGTQLSDKMDATNAALVRMMKAGFADMLKQSNANISMVLAKQVATGDQAKKRRGSVHSAADLAEIDRLKEELAQARANNAAIEEAKRHADENDAAGAAAALENSNASEDVKQSATALVAQGIAAGDENDDWAAAVPLFRKATQQDPGSISAWVGIGYCAL